MKHIFRIICILAFILPAKAASPSYENFWPHDFITNGAAPGKIRLNLGSMTRTPDLPGDIIKLVGGSNYWHLVGNDLSPTVGTSVSTTNLFAYSTLNAAGALILTGTLTTNMVAGTNDVSSLGYDVIRVTGFNASTNGSFLRLYAPGNGLGTILVVQNYSAGSGFTMASDSECAGGDPTMIMRLNGDWTPNRQGESIMLYNYGQGWAEIGRTPTQSITYSTAIFTNVFTTTFVLGGTYITNVLQHPNPTIGYIPYNADGTNFLDSPFYRLTTNSIGFYTTNQFIWQPSSQTLAIGYKALASRDALSGVVAIGPTAMEIASGPLQSVAVGYAALRQSQAADNVAVGHRAMEVAVGANNSTALGYLTLNKVTSGFDNTAIGASSLRDVVTGARNVAGGSSSLLNTTGDDNTAFGYEAGQLNAGGSKNVAMGALAMQQGSGSERIAIGYNALNAGGSTDSVAIGKDSAKTSTGINTTLGTSSGLGLTTGAANTLIGLAAGQGIINGNQNSWLGEYAPDNAGFNAQRSVVAGYRATVGDALTNLVTSILIGNYGASGSFTTAALTNVIGIGNEVRVTNNNEIVIGNSTNTKVIFPITSYTGTGANFLSDDGTYKTAGGAPGGDTLWYQYTNHGTSLSYYLTNSLIGSVLDSSTYIFSGNGGMEGAALTNSVSFTGFGLLAAKGLIDIGGSSNVTAISNGSLRDAVLDRSHDILAFGDDVLRTASVYHSLDITAIADDALYGSKITNCNDLTAIGAFALATSILNGVDNAVAIGNSAISNSSVTNGFNLLAEGYNALSFSGLDNAADITAIANSSVRASMITNSGAIMGLNGGLRGATFNDSHNVVGIGEGAGANVNGAYTNVVFIGNGATAGSTGENQVILGTSMTMESPGGFISKATDAAVAITATGITNALGKNAMVYFDGTTLTFTLKTSGNSPFYTNTVSVGHAEVMLQNGEALMITAGSGTGVLKAF